MSNQQQAYNSNEVVEYKADLGMIMEGN